MKRGKNPRCPAVIYSNDGNSSVSVDSKAQLYVKKNIIPTCEAKNETVLSCIYLYINKATHIWIQFTTMIKLTENSGMQFDVFIFEILVKIETSLKVSF